MPATGQRRSKIHNTKNQHTKPMYLNAAFYAEHFFCPKQNSKIDRKHLP